MITNEHNRFQRVGCVLIPLAEVGRVRDRADGSPCAGRERCGTRDAARPWPRADVGRTRGRARARTGAPEDRKSTRLNSSHLVISYAVFCLKKKKNKRKNIG